MHVRCRRFSPFDFQLSAVAPAAGVAAAGAVVGSAINIVAMLARADESIYANASLNLRSSRAQFITRAGPNVHSSPSENKRPSSPTHTG